MPYQIPVLEKLPTLAPDTKVLVQPKYDGTQGIFTSIDGHAAALTRSGTELFGLRKAAVELMELTRKSLGREYTVFAEVEPFPWSEAGKWALPGKLILGTPVNWKATVFDICPTDGFFAGDYLRKSAYLDRYAVLKSIENSLVGCGFSVAPIQEEEFGRAIEAVNKSFYKDGQGAIRAKWLGIPCEGVVLRHGGNAYKFKPSVERDIYIIRAIRSKKGAPGWMGVDVKEPTNHVEIWGGVTERNWAAMVGKVVEVRELAVSSAKGGGNPTFIRSREYEKEFDATTLEIGICE